ncbi:MAG: transposase [Clostridium sp.]|nr:transposase [Clostridium sp.]
MELLENKMYLGVTIGIIQVLHTWGQELNYYPYIHCINILLIPKEL